MITNYHRKTSFNKLCGIEFAHRLLLSEKD